MIKQLILSISFLLVIFLTEAQKKVTKQENDFLPIPISNADLGVFPYFKTFPNFQKRNESDSVTIEQNRVYFFDGKKYFPVDGKVSCQNLSITDDSKKRPSEFQIIQEFDKIVTTLGGKKIYTGQLPTALLKPIAGTDDIVALYSTHQIAPSAHYGVVEYVIKTPEKEVWIQLQPYSMASNFYTLLIVEKQEQLLTTNTNKKNPILEELEKKPGTDIKMNFALDSAGLLTESGDEILNIVNLFQVHPDWKLKIEVHSAPVGKPGYILLLTQKRAAAIKNQLISLGVKESSVEAMGLGDTKPLAANETEKGRLINTRVEITKF
jgi:OmpA-OmpF porin, OOP family